MKSAIALFVILGVCALLDATPVMVGDSVQSVCYDPLDVGLHRMNIDAWYFNAEENECQYFSFGGGYSASRNNFETKEDCEKTCLNRNIRHAWMRPQDSNDIPTDESILRDRIYFED